MRVRVGMVFFVCFYGRVYSMRQSGETWTWKRAVLTMAQANGRGRQSRLRGAFQPWTGEDRLCRVICIENGADDPHRLGSRTGGGGATTGVHAGVVCCQGRYPRRADCGVKASADGGLRCSVSFGLLKQSSSSWDDGIWWRPLDAYHSRRRRRPPNPATLFPTPPPCRQTQSSPSPRTDHPRIKRPWRGGRGLHFASQGSGGQVRVRTELGPGAEGLVVVIVAAGVGGDAKESRRV